MVIADVDGTLTDGGVYIGEDGQQFKKFNTKDGMGAKLLIKNGYHFGMISHSYSAEMVKTRAKMLGIRHCYVGMQPKNEILDQWIKELRLSLDQIAYLGDDVNDLVVMESVGISVCPYDSVKKVKKSADIVLKSSGGHACLREFVDEYILID